MLDTEGQEVAQLNEENGKLVSNFVTEILVDQNENVWIGQFRGGLHKFSMRRDPTGKPISFASNHFGRKELGNVDIEDIFQDIVPIASDNRYSITNAFN